MDSESALSILLFLVPMTAALVVFGLLRARGMGAGAAGCIAVIAGLGLIALFVLYAAGRVYL